jgi:hypothetical protein
MRNEGQRVLRAQAKIVPKAQNDVDEADEAAKTPLDTWTLGHLDRVRERDRERGKS